MEAAAAPTVVAVGYDGNLLVRVQWDPVPGASQFVVGVLDGDGSVVGSGRGFGVVGSVTLTAPLTPGRSYYGTAAVLDNGQQGPWGSQMLVLLDRLTALAAEYDGGRELRASWTLPAGALPNAATLLLLDTTARRDLAQTVVQGSAGTIALGAPLDATHAYALQASATFGGSTGPPATLPLVVTPASATAVEYDPAAPDVAVHVAMPVPAGCAPGVALFGDGRLVASGGGTGMVVRLALRAPLDAAVAWVVRPFWQAGSARGPYGTGVEVVVSAPRIASVRWAGAELELTWENAPGPPYPTGAQVEVSAPGETTRGHVATDPRRARFTPSPPLLPGSTYTATVAALRGVAEGPESDGAPVIVGTTALTSVAYDGATLAASWSGAAPPGAQTVRLIVREGAATVAQVAASGTTARLPVALDPATAYTAALAWSARAEDEGPIGPTTAVIAGAPQLSTATVANGRVTLAWSGPSAPSGAVTGYEAVFTSPGLPPQTAAISVAQPSVAIPALSSDPLVPLAVAVRATGANASGPLSNALPVLRSAPSLRVVALREDGLHVEWAPLPGQVDAYVATLLKDGAAIATQTVGDTRALLAPGTVASASAYAVSVVARAGGASGPAPGTQPAALLRAPALGAAVFDGATLTATVTAPGGGAPAPDRYEVELLRDGVAVQRATLPPPASGRPLTLTVAATVERGGGALQLAVRAASGVAVGPAATAPALLATPAIDHVDYDGLTVRVAWQGVAGASGYHASVVAAGQSRPAAQDDAGADARALRFPVNLPDTTSDWQVAVHARVGDAGGGPAASAPLFSRGLYLRTDGQPRLFHAGSLARVPVALTAYLPEIGPLTRLPIPDPLPPPATPPFAIVANVDPRSRTAFPYCLQIAGAALDFSSGAAIRADVRSAYDALLTLAEQRGATPWGIVQLQQVIARLLPQTFAETLLYAYGLTPSGASADLRPGLVLRVASAAFDLMPSNRPPAWSSGYAAGATADYEIGDYLDAAPQPANATWLLGFDAFLSWLTANGALTVPSPQSGSGGVASAADFAQSGAADAADLYYPSFRQPFYRLFVPSQLQAATPPAVALTARQFTLAAAATHALIAGAGPAPSPGVAVAYFRGRTVVKLAVRVVVDGEQQLVPVGTTVGNVLDRFGRRPPRAATALRGLRLERSLGPAVLDPAAYDAGASAPVRLDFDGLATFDRRDALSLPLLHGDRLTLGEAAAS